MLRDLLAVMAEEFCISLQYEIINQYVIAMKLLYIVEDKYPPYRSDVVDLFALELSKRGVVIDWLMQRSNKFSSKTTKVKWFSQFVYLSPAYGVKGIIGKLINNVLAVVGDLRVFSLSFKHNYDVIQVRDKTVTSLFALCAAKITGSKFIYWMSYPFPESKIYLALNGKTKYRWIVLIKGLLIKSVLYKIILPLSDHIFVQSRQMQKNVSTYGISLEKLTPIPMGIQKENVSHPDDALPPNRETPVLLYLGLIHRLRQSEILVEVLASVKKKYPGATLIYVGDGQNPEDCIAVKDEARRLCVSESVVITGFLAKNKAWDLVKKADICLSPLPPIPVLLPASPTKLVEYMAMAKCIVANEHPEQCQILQESGVGRCIPWGVKYFADEICWLLDNPEKAKAMAARGPAWVSHNRTYDIIADKVNSVYKNILD